ncbi:MAG: helix-turn-helix domain-containing protein [Aurantibacter sp.]
MDFIFGLAIVCATLFGLLGLYLILTRKGRKIANRILGIFFLLWAIDFFEGALLLHGFYLNHPNAALWTESFLFLYGPLIYFYTLFSIDEKREFRISDLSHLILFFLSFLALLKIYHLQPISYKLEIMKDISALNQPAESFVGFLFVYAHIFYYIFLSYRKLKSAVRDLENYYSYPTLQWLRKLLTSLAIILTVSIVSSILQFLGATLYFIISLIVILLSMGILVGRLIFKALDQQSAILPQNSEKKYSGSVLTESDASEIQSKILKALQEEELYLNPELSLDHLSEKIGIGKRKASQVINERMGKSFFDLINTHRIEKAKQIFKENTDTKLTVLEVLYEVGFNSKSSFNTQFKNKTGLTPSEFQKLNS